MATPSLSSLTQGVGNAGYAVLSWQDPAGFHNVSVSFLPTLMRMVQPQYAPLQKVNISIGGQIHIFEYSPGELLTWPLVFQDLPYDQGVGRFLGRSTDGFRDLLSFIRTTLSYAAQPFSVMTPDGQIETVRYIRGIEQFQEAAGATQKAQFWTGQLTVMRAII